MYESLVKTQQAFLLNLGVEQYVSYFWFNRSKIFSENNKKDEKFW